MERDVKRAKGPDELPVATQKEAVMSEPTIAELEAALQAKDATIERLTKENEELQQKLKNLAKTPLKKGAQTRYWRREEHERFLEALEKFGQRDVKNISSYVGTRSPTQVRTHAQKYFLKQRREETAQMKSANLLARKRRASALVDEEEMEEEEEEEEEGEEEEEEGEDELDFSLTKGSSGGGSGASRRGLDDIADSSEALESSTGRRKSIRVTSAATTIKLRTQDLVAHSHSTRSTSGKRSTPGKSNTQAASGSGANAAAASSSAGSSSGVANSTSTPAPSNNTSNNAGGSGGRKSGPSNSGNAASASTSFSSPGYMGQETASRGQSGGGGNQQQQQQQPSRAQPSPAPGTQVGSPQGAAPPGGYMNPYGHAAPNPYAPGGYAPFRADIFFNADEAALFFKAVKMYERETDRAKVLLSIKEYFLPHRSVEEISNMVDLSFPFDQAAAAGYNPHAAAAAAAAAFHPMYSQGRMYYPDTGAGHTITGSGFGVPTTNPASRQTLGAPGQPPQMPLQQQGQVNGANGMPVVKVSGAGGAPQTSFPANVFSMDHSAPDTDFGAGASHVDPSSLASISDRLSEQMGNTKPNGMDITPAAPSSHTQNNATSAPAKEKDHDDEDSSLMSELTSLTDRGNTVGGGLSSFLGGRPLALSPGVFGATPLGFGTGITPLMSGSTPLGFMSPLGLNFATHSPVNPYFAGQK
eukprot:gnl/Hemi2/16722_TR5605_c0_g1_i1.p1 gnl/Hemi2/16722_TR5605_c0_g1~~gnl/Hemi2/16722_TR5605_c0_g1_i1.p1  ORF type:complete len:699 (-),score=54.64 gnl/Hemi2/16722_TR5605_c0_g1_i1:197-2293(-)